MVVPLFRCLVVWLFDSSTVISLFLYFAVFFVWLLGSSVVLLFDSSILWFRCFAVWL